MIDPANVPDVAANELLARFVLQGSHVRSSNQTVKPDAFIPPPNGKMSVTRHLMATEEEIWEVGRRVATQRSKTLYGRGDVTASAYRAQNLSVEADDIPGNPNHTHVLNWPSDKAAQKMIASEIAAAAKYVPIPSST
jgi:hypothetical protein